MYHSLATTFCIASQKGHERSLFKKCKDAPSPFSFECNIKTSWPFNTVALTSSKSTTAQSRFLVVQYKYIFTKMLHIIWF